MPALGLRSPSEMTTFSRYWLLQIPGWVLTAAIGVALHEWFGLPRWTPAALCAAVVLKDAALYPFLLSAYESSGGSPLQAMVGKRGVVKRELSPRGQVQVNGELWQARPLGPDQPAVGDTVTVAAVEGMTLVVAAYPDTADSDDSDVPRP